jgi:hypothetical protein
MAGFPLWALALSATVDLRVATPQETRPECSAQALVQTLQVLRPELRIEAGEASPGTLSVTLQRQGATYVLQFRGPEIVVERSFPDSGDCLGAIRTGALIIDGALDQLVVHDRTPVLPPIPPVRPPSPPPSAPASPRSAPLPARRWEWSAAIGGGAGQGMLSAAPAVALQTTLHRGLLELGASGDVLTPTTAPIQRNMPQIGAYEAFSVDGEVAAGVAPHLGPGQVSIDAIGGLAWTSVQVHSSVLLQQRSLSATELFVALRVAYALDLPARFFLLGLVEERYAPDQAAFIVTGEAATVSTRHWTTAGLVAIGRHFF